MKIVYLENVSKILYLILLKCYHLNRSVFKEEYWRKLNNKL